MPLFGDLHVHTALSNDAYSFGLRVGPDGAYRYAFGEPIGLPPHGPGGDATREVRIDRPLDFAAVTDHAEFLGEGVLCTDPDSEVYDTEFCAEAFRTAEGRPRALLLRIFSPWSWRDSSVCGDDGARCARAAAGAWQEIVRAAEAWNDPAPACARTTFAAYEYSSHRLGSNLHRNVIFAGSAVPALPTSYLEANREWKLWEALDRDCIGAGTGCDALAIPHNSNLSGGRMFKVDYPGAWGLESKRARAALRVRMEPIVEIMQHKGDSECREGLPGVVGSDELCGFEKFESEMFVERTGSADPGECYEGPLADWLPHLTCLSRQSYVRGALIEGLRQEAELGVNPFKVGLMASTDTHNALAGGVDERTYPGHLGNGDATAERRTTWDGAVPGNARNNPGGLIGVWAEENSRASIFAAMRRREVFGTSGPRIVPRFFGGWVYRDDLCDDPGLVRRAYDRGLPMGSDLPPRPAGAGAPVFLATALADPGTPDAPGGLLQRIQVIKGWIGEDGAHHQRVFEVAGTPGSAADVDLETCRPRGPGHARLCSIWRDPEFDPEVRAVYYARVVENPSCRYTAWQCLSLRDGRRPGGCDDPARAKLIQERAWTSPIWYTPPD